MGEVSALQVRPAEVGAFQMRLAEVGLLQVRRDEGSPLQVRDSEESPLQMRLVEISSLETQRDPSALAVSAGHGADRQVRHVGAGEWHTVERALLQVSLCGWRGLQPVVLLRDEGIQRGAALLTDGVALSCADGLGVWTGRPVALVFTQGAPPSSSCFPECTPGAAPWPGFS
jgi:hypothetical protein